MIYVAKRWSCAPLEKPAPRRCTAARGAAQQNVWQNVWRLRRPDAVQLWGLDRLLGGVSRTACELRMALCECAAGAL